jgi:Zn-dependent peptidase ImmA (M78 family)
MAKSPPSKATPAMLKWAREVSRISPPVAASAVKCSEDQILAWERGDGTPSLPRLRKLASKYRFPLMVFYLKEPPKFSIKKLADFRTLASQVIDEFSPELTYEIRVASERQAWARSYLEENESEKCALVNFTSVSAGVKPLAAKLRAALNVTVEQQTNAKAPRDAYLLWRAGCETNGIFVFQASGVPVEEMRGCAIPDPLAPVILVNGKDAYSAKTFTLVHELAHIATGSSAITGGGQSDFVAHPVQAVERFCNAVAAEVLLPAEELTKLFPSNWQSQPLEWIGRCSKRFKVSMPVVGLRLLEVGLADRALLDKLWPAIQTPAVKGGGPTKQYQKAINRTGEAFARLAVSAYHSGEIHGGQLTRMLRMSLKYLAGLESQLYPSRRSA